MSAVRPEGADGAPSFRSLITSVQGVITILTLLGIIGGFIYTMSGLANALDKQMNLIDARLTGGLGAISEAQRQEKITNERQSVEIRELLVAIAELRARQDAELRRVMADNEWLRRQVLEMRPSAQPRRPDVDRQAGDADDLSPEDELREAWRRPPPEGGVVEAARPPPFSPLTR